jgi:hypothetical protein
MSVQNRRCPLCPRLDHEIGRRHPVAFLASDHITHEPGPRKTQILAKVGNVINEKGQTGISLPILQPAGVAPAS